MNIENKIASNQEELEEFLVFQLLGRKSISAIVEYDTLTSILENIEQYIDESVDRYKCRILSDEDELYVITKEEYEGYIILEVSPLFVFNKEIEDYDIAYIESDVVYIEDMEYNVCDELEEELDNSICSDEIFNLYVDDELEEDIDDFEEGPEKKCNYCNCEEDETLQVLLDEYTEKVLETEGCPGCIRQILEELYHQGYKEGLTDELLLQNEITQDRLFGEDGLLN